MKNEIFNLDMKFLTNVLKDAGITYSLRIYIVETIDPQKKTETHGVYSSWEQAMSQMFSIADEWCPRSEDNPRGYIHERLPGAIRIKYPDGKECMIVNIRTVILNNEASK